MKRNLSLYIIIIPILFVLISIASVTLHNINTIQKNGENSIKNFENSYLVEQKTLVYNRVHYFSNLIAKKKMEFQKEKDKYLKEKNYDIYNMAYEIYEKNRNKSKDFIKNEIVKSLENLKLKSESEDFALIDLSQKKFLHISKNQTKIRDVLNIHDMTGRKIFSKNSDFDNHVTFNTFDEKNNKFIEKISYLKTFQELDLVILYCESLENIEKDMAKNIIEYIKESNIDTTPYIFIFKINNLNGGENFGKILYHQSRPQLEGRTLNEVTNDENMTTYRQEYLSKLKVSGEGFITYYFAKPETNKTSKKISYFFYIKDLKWAIGTGFYLDDLEIKVLDFKKKIDLQTKENINVAVFISLFLTIAISMILLFITTKINSLINSYANGLKEKSKSFERQKEVFETLFEKSSDGILLHDMSGFISNCNSAILEMLGCDDKNLLIGRAISNISSKTQMFDISSEKLFSEYMDKSNTKSFFHYEWILSKKDRSKLYCEFVTTKINLEGTEIFHTTVRDITYRKKLEEQNKNQQLVLAEESKKAAMGEMITMIAHQWRQPLNNVNLLIHFVRDNIESNRITKEQLSEIALDMKNQIEYMSRTIDDFTNFINPRKVVNEFMLSDAIEKTLNLLKGPIEKRSIEIIKDIENCKIHGIENEFMQVLLNIFNNAKDSMEEIKTPRLLYIRSKIVNNKLMLTIKDNAGGIPKDLIGRIFEPYFTTKHKQNGTGIGLYMSEKIIKQYKNGQLKASNEHFYHKETLYKGAMFTITFDLD